MDAQFVRGFTAAIVAAFLAGSVFVLGFRMGEQWAQQRESVVARPGEEE